MEILKPIWRVNRSPRFTTLELGEYMAADDGPRDTILRNMKYERIAPTVMYATLNQAVSSYLTSATRDERILDRARQALVDERDAAENPRKRDNLTYELRALDTFRGSLNALGLRDATFEKLSATGRKFEMGGINVSVRPTALVRISRPRGKDLIGSILIDLAKGVGSPKTADARARLQDSMEHSAALLQRHAAEMAGEMGEDVKLSPAHCIVFHTHAQLSVGAPTNSRKLMRNMEAACRTIRRGWNDVEPPPTFDPKRAKYRP